MMEKDHQIPLNMSSYDYHISFSLHTVSCTFLSALYALMQKSLSFCFLGLGRGILFVMVLDIGNHFLFPVFRIELDIDTH